MPIGAIISIIATLLPEIVALAKSWKDTPQEEQKKILESVRAAFVQAKSSPGNTAPIERIIND